MSGRLSAAEERELQELVEAIAGSLAAGKSKGEVVAGLTDAGMSVEDAVSLVDQIEYGMRHAAVEEEEGSGLSGIIIFILIFGVGNLILYSTTGIFLIPIPRK